MANALATIAICAASPALAGQTVTAEQALENYRKAFKPVTELACPTEEDSEDIVVCGRRNAVDPDRLPLAVAREPGSFTPGEPRGMGPDCIRSCPQPVQINILTTVPAIVKGIKRLLNPDR